MMLKIYRVADSTWYDISDYVTDTGNFTIYERNEDFKMVVPTSTISVSFLFDETISIGDTLQLYMDSTHYYNYTIKDVQYKYPKRVYDITIETTLGLLKEFKVDRTNLDTLLKNTSDANNYRFNDNGISYIHDNTYGWVPMSNFKVLWVIQKMFEVCNLTIDTSSVEEIVLGKMGWQYRVGRDYSNSSVLATVKGKDLKIDSIMLYMLGVDRASDDQYYWTGGESLPVDGKDRITMWDFISEICFHFGWLVYQVNGDNYKMISKDDLGLYTPTDSVLINKEQKKYYRKYFSGIQYSCLSNSRYLFYTNGWQDNIEQKASSEMEKQGRQSDNIYVLPKNFRFLVADENGSAGDIISITLQNGGDFWTAGGISWTMYYRGYGNYTNTYADVETKNYTKYTYTMEMKSFDTYYNVLSISYDIKNRTSVVETMLFD